MTNRRATWLRVGLWLLILLWIVVAYSLSAQVADDSIETSGRLIRWLLSHFDTGFLDLTPEEQLLRVGEWSFVVRKSAHFVLYAALGLLTMAAFSLGRRPRRPFPAALGLGALLAVLDEVHQAFVPGRSCELRDMAIDAGGVLLGAAFLWFILWLIRRRKSNRTNE